MSYRVEFTPNAEKSLKALEKPVVKVIRHWIFKNLQDTDNPRKVGKALKGNLQPFWRYRIGDYRLIARIEDKELIIIAVEVGHRGNVYDKLRKKLKSTLRQLRK